MGAWWPALAWVLTGISAAMIVWLIAWLLSWRRLPYRLDGDVLVLPMGILRTVRVPLRDIGEISHARLKDKGTANLVPVAFPIA